MNDDIAIKVENVSKKFSRTLKKSMLYGVTDIGRNALSMSSKPEKLRKGEFWAVDDVSFELKKGETLGLIGPNGSGKTTLLKMLNGIFWPDQGKITINGRIGALIAVGAGFHPMLTGRENIYINAAILGMTKEEVDEKYDDIVKFADIGDFLDTPVKFYSSGMFVRLGFAVAVHCEPEILLVDEVLSVGDVGFRLKCLNKMKELMDSGISIILVSHNLVTVSEISNRVIALNKGKIISGPGDPDKVIADAQALYAEERLGELPKASPEKKQNNKSVEITNIELLDSAGNVKTTFSYDEEFRTRVYYDAHEVIEEPNFGVEIKREDGIVCFIKRSPWDKFKIEKIEKKGYFEMIIDGLYLAPMNYSTRVVIADSSNSIPIITQKGPDFTVKSPIPFNNKGIYHPKSTWRTNNDK